MQEMFDPRKEFGRAVTEIAQTNERIVVFSADSGKSSGFGDFANRFPDRYYECGIMEQGIIGLSAGIATTGRIPVFCAIAPFVTCRPYEMVRNDVGYMNQNVKIVGRNCGFTYSDLGSTHHSLDDFAIMRMIPGMVVLAPQDVSEIHQGVKAMIEHVGPVYMRIGNPKIPKLFEDAPVEIGKGRLIYEGSDVTIISTGSTTQAAIQAVDALKQKGVSAQLIGMMTVSPIDKELIVGAAKKTGKIITIEEHYVDGGLGTIVTEVLSEMREVSIRRIGVPKLYATSGSYADLLRYYRLDSASIVEQAMEFLSND